jgi:DNA-binding NtrC family response regulator
MDPTGPQPIARHRLRLLLVDDDRMLLRAWERVIRAHCDVVTAEDAMSAVPWLTEELDAIATDLAMGEGKPDGRWLLDEARRLAPRATRILLSGAPQVLTPKDGELWHFAFRKPVLHTEILRALGLTLPLPP